MPPSVIELVGQVLAPALTLERELAVKANARVFRAFDQVTQQTVVVKVFFDAGIDSADAQRFQREIALAQALAHPGIVPILRWGREGRFVYYVMPFLPGGSLRDLIDRDGPLSLARTRALVAAVAEALAFAHARGIAHRDIKPGPILLDAEGRAFVSDLGIARAVGPADVGEGITSTGVTVGTPAYMSPEQAAADPRIDARTDQYALACVAFEMLTGAPPFLGAAPQDVLARHRLEQPPELRVVRPDVPASVEAAIRRALAKARAERFADIRAFADAFARDGSAWSATVGSTTTITRRAFGTSRVGLAMALLVLTAAIGALLVRRPVRAQVEALDPSRVAVFDFAAPADADALRALGTSLADALARRLAATQAITVLSRDAVRAMHERGQPLDSLVARLHPGSVIEGSLAQSAGRLHVEVRLVDAATQVLVASTTVERPIGEQFQLADELGETVVRLLRPRIGAEVESRTRSRGTDDAEARDLAFRAERAFADAMATGATGVGDAARTLEGLRRADSLLALAERRDPAWADARLQRGWVHVELARRSAGSARQRGFAFALAQADDVLVRAANDPMGRQLRGATRYWMVVDGVVPESLGVATLEQARADLAIAITSRQARPAALGVMSLLLAAQGKFEAADTAARQALDLDEFKRDGPLVLQSLFGSAATRADWPRAREWCARGAADYPAHHWFVECALTLAANDPGDHTTPARAAQLVARGDALDPPAAALAAGHGYSAVFRQLSLAMVWARAGRADSARAIAARARLLTVQDSSLAVDMLYDSAYLHELLGERAAAVDELRTFMQTRPGMAGLVQRHRRWDPLRPALDSLSRRRPPT